MWFLHVLQLSIFAQVIALESICIFFLCIYNLFYVYISRTICSFSLEFLSIYLDLNLQWKSSAVCILLPCSIETVYIKQHYPNQIPVNWLFCVFLQLCCFIGLHLSVWSLVTIQTLLHPNVVIFLSLLKMYSRCCVFNNASFFFLQKLHTLTVQMLKQLLQYHFLLLQYDKPCQAKDNLVSQWLYLWYLDSPCLSFFL